MHYPRLEILVGTAGLDAALCERLLNGHRSQVITAFNLSKAEKEAVLAIKADSLPGFAMALLNWMEQQDAAQYGSYLAGHIS
jgi:hypothetical protein